MLEFSDKLTFTKAVYHSFYPIPLPHPFKDATGGFGVTAPMAGWLEVFDGEGNSAGGFCGAGAVDALLPLILTGESRTYNQWYHHLYWRFRNFGFQSGEIALLGQFDIMMLALLASRKNMPLHRFLGAKRDWAKVYKGGGALTLEDGELVDDMCRYVDEGYRTIKFKVGSDWGHGLDRDVRRLELVRKAVGDDIEVAVDGNQVWNVEDALEFARRIRPYNAAWFEEPVHSHDMRAIKEFTGRVGGMQVAYGESMRNYYAFETYVEKGVTHLMPLIGRISGVDELFRTHKLAKDKGLSFSSGGTTFLNAAMGACYREEDMIEYHEPITFTLGQWLKVKPQERDGRFYLEDIPGMPIRIDLEKLEKCGKLESTGYFYSDSLAKTFAVRAAY